MLLVNSNKSLSKKSMFNISSTITESYQYKEVLQNKNSFALVYSSSFVSYFTLKLLKISLGAWGAGGRMEVEREEGRGVGKKV